MSTPDNSSRSQSTSDDFSLFKEVISSATSPERPPVERVKNAVSGVLRSYKFVTESAIDSSSQETSQSTTASTHSTFRNESSRSNIPGSSDSWSEDGAIRVASRSGSSTSGAPSTFPRFSRLGRSNRIRVAKDDDAAAVQPTTSEVWGWLLCEVGMSGFKATLWVFFPLLIFSLFAATGGFTTTAVAALHCPYNVTDRDPRCLKVCDSFTKDLTSWTSDSLGGNQSRSSGITILEILSARSWQPAVLITAMLGASVVLQLILFTITSPLLDFGRYQSFLLWLGTGMGVVTSAITINIFRAAWWWLGGILFLFSTVGLGLVSTWLDSYFSSLARGIPILKTQLFDEVQIFQSVRLRFVYKVSLTGVMIGCLSAGLCALAAFFFLRSSLVPKLMGIDPNNWSLRIACCIGGVWLLCWTLIPTAFLIKDRPGPSLRYIPHPPAKHLLMAVLRMRIGTGKGRSGLLLLLVCFLSSMGNATVFHSGLLCFSPRNFITFALLSHMSSFAGAVLFYIVQNALSWSSKVMLLIALLVHLLLPIYACVGFLFTTPSKKSKVLRLDREWEFLAFAFAYGVCLGAHRSYIRTLFLACIPGPTLVGAYFSFLALVNQFSTFVGSVQVFLFVRYNRDLRYTFVIMGVALLLASILMLTYITISQPAQHDFDGMSDTDVSLYHSDASYLMKSSVEASSKSDSDSPSVHVPRSLRTQFSELLTV